MTVAVASFASIKNRPTINNDAYIIVSIVVVCIIWTNHCEIVNLDVYITPGLKQLPHQWRKKSEYGG